MGGWILPVGLLIREKTAIENPFMFSPEASFEFGFCDLEKKGECEWLSARIF